MVPPPEARLPLSLKGSKNIVLKVSKFESLRLVGYCFVFGQSVASGNDNFFYYIINFLMNDEN